MKRSVRSEKILITLVILLPIIQDLGSLMNHQSKKASLSAFCHGTVDNVSKLIMSMPSKSCALDILPMWLLKENIEVVAKPITSIINVSLSTGIFPSKLREAVVSPLLKKAISRQRSVEKLPPRVEHKLRF